MDELKPCPFCGGEAAFLGTTCTIKCKQCGGAFIATNPVLWVALPESSIRSQTMPPARGGKPTS